MGTINFISLPEDYAPVDAPLEYTATLGEHYEGIEVEVFDARTSQRKALCRLHDTSSVCIDIAPYVRRMFDPQPAAGWYSAIIPAEGRTVEVQVAVGGVLSPVRRFTLFPFDGLPRLLTTMPAERTLAPGEYDELPFYAPEGGCFEIISEDEEGRQTVCGTIYSSPSEDIRIFRLAEDVMVVPGCWCRVRFEAGDRCEEVVYRRVMRPAGARRLAWLAATGAVEYYTFPQRRRSILAVEKQHYCNGGGYTTVDICAERSELLLSEFEPAAMADALEEIVSSPRVWIAGAEGVTEVYAVSTECVRTFGAEPARVAVEIRYGREEAAVC